MERGPDDSGAPEHTFREIDAALGLPKGSAFRAFKRLRETLAEGRDFQVLYHDADAARIEALRTAGRIYPGTVNAVLLSSGAAARVRQALTDGN